jgi:class 3 adenylate cyclase/DNA-binding winged helix-turn-helix (wHTH) protein
MNKVSRRLAAVLIADIVGYSRLMQADEVGTLTGLQRYLTEEVEPRIAGNGGRIVKTLGDGILAEFPSTVNAVRCALSLLTDQKTDPETDEGKPSFQIRIGISVGDVMVDARGDIFGEVVNVAARLEGLAEPGSILVTSSVRDQVIGKVEAHFEHLGEHQLKNMAGAVTLYQVLQGGNGNHKPPISKEVGTRASDFGRSFLFENFRFDMRLRQLYQTQPNGSEHPLSVGSRALEILAFLIEKCGDVVAKQELMEAVWPNTAVEENNLTVQISGLRRVLDVGRTEGSCIQTIPGRGYRFVPQLTAPGTVDISRVETGWHSSVPTTKAIKEHTASLSLDLLPAIIAAATGPLKKITDEQRAAIGVLEYRLGTNESQLLSFFRIIGEAEIVPERMGQKLVEIAEQYRKLLGEVASKAGDEPAVAQLKAKAHEALESADFGSADALLAAVEKKQEAVRDSLDLDAAAVRGSMSKYGRSGIVRGAGGG